MRKTNRQTNTVKHKGRQADIETGNLIDRQKGGRQADDQTDKQTDRHTDKHNTNRETNTKTHKQSNRQTYTETNRRTSRQKKTDKQQTDIQIYKKKLTNRLKTDRQTNRLQD